MRVPTRSFPIACCFLMSALVPAASGAAPLFQAGRLSYGSFEGTAAAIADFDGDGLPDVISWHYTPVIQLYRFKGGGDGTLTPLPPYPVPRASGLAAADLNGDNQVDLVSVGSLVSVMLGNGDLTFAASVDYGTPQGGAFGGRTVAIADLTGDLVLDVLASDTTDAVHIWPGVGDGTLAPPIVLGAPGGGAIDFVAALDLDGNGHLDVVAAGDSFFVFLGSGAGAFSAPDVYEIQGNVAVGFVNADAIPDLVTMPDWLAGQGDGTFAAPVAMGGGISGYFPVVADVTGDGNGDLLVLNGDVYDFTDARYVDVHPGDGAGGFGPAIRSRTTTHPFIIEPADLDLDGKLDLIVGSASSYPMEVFRGNGDGTFGAVRDLDTPGDPAAVLIAEVTGDAHADVLALCPSTATLRVFPGLGDGTLDTPADLTTPADPRRVAVGDVNGDGRADLVTANGSSNSISVFPALPGGGFGARTDHAIGFVARDVVVADMNGDLIGDIVTDGLSVLPGQNGAPPGAPVVYPGIGGYRLSVGHVNADAYPDVLGLVALGFQWGWRVAPGAAGGALGAPYDVPCGAYTNFTGSGAVGDVNGDGTLDLVVIDTQSALAVRLGNGDGTFAASIHQGYPTAVPRRCWALALGDLNGDGDMDLFTGNLDNVGGSASLGDGTGAFYVEAGYGSGGWPVDVALGDLDGDGHLDAVLANYYASSITILMDNAAPTASVVPPATKGGRLAFARVWPMPARGGALHASITLPARGEARLEFVDVGGRRIVRQSLGVIDAGSREVGLNIPAGLRPGVYWLRLEQGGRAATARVAVLR